MIVSWDFKKESEKKPQTDNIVWISERIDTDTSDVPVQRISCVDLKACKKNNIQSIKPKSRTHIQ